jgi:hypothetical protein
MIRNLGYPCTTLGLEAQANRHRRAGALPRAARGAPGRRGASYAASRAGSAGSPGAA